jgi:hypothetical protein
MNLGVCNDIIAIPGLPCDGTNLADFFSKAHQISHLRFVISQIFVLNFNGIFNDLLPVFRQSWITNFA